MIDPRVVKQQLHRVGADQAFWGRPELAELPKIMIDGEVIEYVRHGHYAGGFATLVATNHRLLLVDKKPLFLTVEDIRYDMVAEVDYGHQFVGGTIHIRSFSKDLKFQSFDTKGLRQIAGFVQHKVMEQRGHHTQPIDQPGTTASNAAQVQMQSQRQAIPMQVFGVPNQLTDEQANGLVPLDQESWYKLHPNRQVANPYVQTPLMYRRRVGRYAGTNNT